MKTPTHKREDHTMITFGLYFFEIPISKLTKKNIPYLVKKIQEEIEDTVSMYKGDTQKEERDFFKKNASKEQIIKKLEYVIDRNINTSQLLRDQKERQRHARKIPSGGWSGVTYVYDDVKKKKKRKSKRKIKV